jgi:tetratricopeptide (TPR) repeat protein
VIRRSPRARGVVTLALGATLVLAGAVAAQEQEADAAWHQGRMDDARAAYRSILAQDSMAFVANLRLGLLLAWQGKLDSSLALIGRARRADPRDPEARLIQARVLAWQHRYAAALAGYDSVLADQPGLIEAQVGRAQVRAWRGDLEAAEREYRSVVVAHPRNAEALAGLGFVYHWQGRDGPAERMAREALAADSSSEPARELARAVRGVVRAATELSAGWSHDSDHNTDFWQMLTASAPAGPGLRLLGSAGVLEASDPLRTATRFGAEAGLTWSVGDIRLTGAGGARRLIPETAARTVGTYRGRLSWRPVRQFGVSAGYARAPFDEIASLMERDLNLEGLDAGFDLGLARGLRLSASGGGAWLSDGNHRTQAETRATLRVSGGLSIGGHGRTMAYERVGQGYFSPDRFHLLEGLAGYELESGQWSGGLAGGLGVQQIGRGGSDETEWHVDLRAGHRWGIGNRIDLFGGVTNNAASSTTGAFRYGTAGVSVRIGM